MKSFIQIPARYDMISVEGGIRVVCTAHSRSQELRHTGKVVGVDEVLRLVEDHEREAH